MQANRDGTPDMSSYQDVLSLAQRLSPNEQIQLIEALTTLMHQPVEVEGSDELFPVAEIAESEATLQNYWKGSDRGLSAADLKQKIMVRLETSEQDKVVDGEVMFQALHGQLQQRRIYANGKD